MQAIHRLHDFFTLTGAEVRLYHMGRRVHPCALETLADFESGQVPWPEPWQGRARLALVFRLGDMSDPLIWFLALPVDEQGLLDAAQRDAFLERLLSTLGRSAEALEQSDGGEIDNNTSLYIDASISVTGMSFSVNPDDATTAELTFSVRKMNSVFGLS